MLLKTIVILDQESSYNQSKNTHSITLVDFSPQNTRHSRANSIYNIGLIRDGTAMCYLPQPFCIYISFPPNGVIQQVDFFQMLVQNTATRRESGADLGYVYTELVMGLVSVIQQTLSSGKIILQTLRGGKPTRKLQDILSILLISIIWSELI